MAGTVHNSGRWFILALEPTSMLLPTINRFQKGRLYGCLFLFSFIVLSCHSQKNATGARDSLPASSLHVYGRSLVNEKQQLELISSAVHFGFSFNGSQCRIYASLPDPASHNYLQYELDGVYQKRI